MANPSFGCRFQDVSSDWVELQPPEQEVPLVAEEHLKHHRLFDDIFRVQQRHLGQSLGLQPQKRPKKVAFHVPRGRFSFVSARTYMIKAWKQGTQERCVGKEGPPSRKEPAAPTASMTSSTLTASFIRNI